ncbi:MAG: histidinol-phosphatase HisJ family protein [Acidimicrobiia bacterium]|nr:histidinol-phosphatase HisJ family protein [Acidimicrobiia bacterium]
MTDSHVHLHPHGPYSGSGPQLGEYPPAHLEAYVEHAASVGVAEVAFTEHLYRCVESAEALGEFWETAPTPELRDQCRDFVAEDRTLSLDHYVDAVLAAKDRGLPVTLGLEVDFFPETIEAVLRLLEPYPWDVLIGSVHWIGGWSVDHDDATFEFDRRGVDQSYRDYFALEAELAGSGAVDVLAHCDVVKKFGHRPTSDPVELYERVVKEAVASGTAVEVSSAGLYKPVGEIYPAPDFLGMFAAAGVPITLASDAHFPHEAGRDFGQLRQVARDAGYTHHVRFEARRAHSLAL